MDYIPKYKLHRPDKQYRKNQMKLILIIYQEMNINKCLNDNKRAIIRVWDRI